MLLLKNNKEACAEEIKGLLLLTHVLSSDNREPFELIAMYHEQTEKILHMQNINPLLILLLLLLLFLLLLLRVMLLTVLHRFLQLLRHQLAPRYSLPILKKLLLLLQALLLLLQVGAAAAKEAVRNIMKAAAQPLSC